MWTSSRSRTRCRSGRRRAKRARVAITFDDGYRGALRHGIEELTRRGLPATVFVCPGLLDGHAFWWDRYAAHPDPAAFRASALEEHRGREDSVCRWAAAQGVQAATLPDYMTSASLDELKQAATGSGITVGRPHVDAPEPRPGNGSRAAGRSWCGRPEWLAESFGDDYRPYLAYPYGLWNAQCEREASDAGYDAAFLVRGGWFRPGAVDPFVDTENERRGEPDDARVQATPRRSASPMIISHKHEVHLHQDGEDGRPACDEMNRGPSSGRQRGAGAHEHPCAGIARSSTLPPKALGPRPVVLPP